MQDYIQEFVLLVSQAPTVQGEQLMGYFLAGLQPKIKQQLRPHNPKELARAMEIALDLEETTYHERRRTEPSSFPISLCGGPDSNYKTRKSQGFQ